MAQIKLSSIKPNPRNPRTIKDEKFQKLVKSIREFPKMMELRPLVTDDAGMVLGGNQRLKALQELGYKEIPREWVKRASDLTPEEQKRFVIADNVAFGENDWDVLKEDYTLEELEDWGMDIPDFTDPQALEEDEYEIPDEIETDIVAGDLFEIGPHRLLCGDSTVKEKVDTLLAGAGPILMVTDPPYGVNYDAGWRDDAAKYSPSMGNRKDTAKHKVNNDNRIDWTETYYHFPGHVLYIWHGGRHAAEVANNIEKANFQIICQIIWAKNHLAISRGDYHWQHEPCWYAVRKGKRHNWQGDRSQTTVWNIDRLRKLDTGHSTQKPVECMGRPIKNNTQPGDGVYDPFLGSGTTMVAAHQLGRICFGIEIDPKYVQIVVDRMLSLDPSLVVKKNGELYVNQTVNKQ